MITEKIMERPFLKGVVRQNHKTGYFEIKGLENEVNRKRLKKNKPLKKHSEYLRIDATVEFLEALSMEEGLPISDLVITKRGRNGGTWVHPLVFLDFALWTDVKLKVKVYKWIYDNLLAFRDNSGDSFKLQNTSLYTTYPKAFKNKYMYSKVANVISDACRVPRVKERWQTASEAQLKMRDDIHNNISLICELAPTDVWSTLTHAIERTTRKE